MSNTEIEILVLDDEASIRWVIEKTLADAGHGLHFAESAEEAAALMTSLPIDLALVDINLPGDDGFTFLQSQRAQYPDLLSARERRAVEEGQGLLHRHAAQRRASRGDLGEGPGGRGELTFSSDLARLSRAHRRHSGRPLRLRSHR